MANLFFVVLSLLLVNISASAGFKILHSWNEVKYQWDSPEQEAEFRKNGLYIPENNIITGLKSYKNVMYVTVSRWRPGVPSTLNTVVTNPQGESLLKPFPSWSFQNCSSYDGFRFVQSMEIDGEGIMWIIDMGRLNIFGEPSTISNGPPRLMLYHLEKGVMLKTFVFPHNVASYDRSFLNDIVVDAHRGFAYISDAGTGALIVYDRFRNRAQRWESPSTKNNPLVAFNINGIDYGTKIQIPVDGIALAADASRVYYCALQGDHLFSVATSSLMDFDIPDGEIELSVMDHGQKPPSDGMAVDAQGVLYFGDLNGNKLYRWETWKPFSTYSLIAHDDTLLQWIDTFAFDGHGNLLFTANRLQLYYFKTIDWADHKNYAIVSVNIGSNSYLSSQRPYRHPCQYDPSRPSFTGSLPPSPSPVPRDDF